MGEEKDTIEPGLVHRYPDRVLVTLTDMSREKDCFVLRGYKGDSFSYYNPED